MQVWCLWCLISLKITFSLSHDNFTTQNGMIRGACNFIDNITGYLVSPIWQKKKKEKKMTCCGFTRSSNLDFFSLLGRDSHVTSYKAMCCVYFFKTLIRRSRWAVFPWLHFLFKGAMQTDCCLQVHVYSTYTEWYWFFSLSLCKWTKKHISQNVKWFT